ncbi:MAG: hypothetical protein ABFD70_00215 [Syntrophaceae bacterium]
MGSFAAFVVIHPGKSLNLEKPPAADIPTGLACAAGRDERMTLAAQSV